MYGGAAGWLRTRVEHEQMAVHDSDATAAVLLAAITYYRVLDALLGVVPGDVDEESFLRAWLELAAGLRPDRPQETS